MAQLKIKQISDFISGVNAIHNGAAGTDTVTAISTAKSEAISQAVVNGDIAYDVNGAGAAAIAAAESKDVLRASTTASNLGTAVSNLESYADQAEVDAKSYADGLASNYDASGSASDAEIAAIASAESKDVVRATASQAYADQAELDAIAAAESKDAVRATASQSYADQAEADAIATAGSYTDTREISILSVLRGELATVSGTDKLKQKASFVSTTEFSVATAVDTDNNDILVFVNGLQVYKIIGGSGSVGWSVAANGEDFTVRGLGYTLENSDHIIVVGVAN